MRLLSAAGLLLLSSTNAQAAEPKPTGCDGMLGVWEYLPPSAPGYTIVTRQGNRYLGIFVNTLPEPYSEPAKTPAAREKGEPQSDAYSVAGAWEYTCDSTPGALRLALRWLYSSYRPQDVGSEAVLEVELAGKQAKWWFIGPDGRRATMGAGRLLK